MTRFKLRFDNLIIGKSDFEYRVCEQQRRGYGSSIVALKKEDKHHIFLDVLDDCNKHVGYILLDENQNEYEIEVSYCGKFRSIGGVKKSCCPEPTWNYIGSESRLDKLERKIKELQDEVDCIRRGD
jgi:hypothetical protein